MSNTEVQLIKGGIMKNGMVKIARSAAVALGLLATLVLASESFAAKQLPTLPVDINKAGVEELMTIPGVGKSKADAIVAYRSTKPFSSPEQLVDVKGIGEKMFAKISSYVTVSGKTAAVQPGTAEKAAR